MAPNFKAPTSYERIQAYSKALKEFIEKNGIPFGLEKFPYEIKMDFNIKDKKGLGRLKADLECNRVICVLGLGPGEDESMEFKVSFLGLDDKDDVDPRHKPVKDTNPKKLELIDGEETWPPGDTITDPTVPLP